MIRVGLLGCGNIGQILARKAEGIEIAAVFDQVCERAERVAGMLGAARCHSDFAPFVRDDFDLLLEAASVDAVQTYGEEGLRQGKDLIILSVGAFADPAFRRRLEEVASHLGRTIRIPSGALFGLDNVKIGQVSRLDRVRLRTTKNPASLGMELNERTLLFRGSAAECIQHYPRNINVAVALGLAADREVEVEIWADPAVSRNSHEVVLSGEFGEANLATFNLPSPDNPATSYLAALSILTLLRNLGRSLQIGT
jgi:aspartate dehydrogenase